MNETAVAPRASSHRIGLAVSGGGFRAAAFHCGVLKRLEELGLLSQVCAVSSVSGGSIALTAYAQRCVLKGDGTPGSSPVEPFVDSMAEALSKNLRRRAFLGTPRRCLRFVGSWLIPGLRRAPLLEAELDRAFYRGGVLADLPAWLAINATSIRTGKNWRFYADRMGDYLIGATDATAHVPIAKCVAASAAYPILTDPVDLPTRWEDLRGDLLDSRWQRPPTNRSGSVSRWRECYGKPRGRVHIPLVDGGLYDNEGLIALRAARVNYAIVASVAPPDTDFTNPLAPLRLLRFVDIIHGRLGSATRQLVHEMTHGADPGETRTELLSIAEELSALRSPATDDAARALRRLAAVGWPPRGPQFLAYAPILLHREDLARNTSSRYTEAPYDVPADDRGLELDLVRELALVRTDLDALEPEVFELLVAQAYFLTDASLKVAMPELVCMATGAADRADPSLRPAWNRAHAAIQRANANHTATLDLLRRAAPRRILGRGERDRAPLPERL